ncbi:MAG: DNA-directed RNA polymerase subunit beta' [Alphaproteobacteria bacterium]|jgi:DNA-directed RNA polymerase subunit beta'|nr:DNA-directed RNA polymerase subunit beta' [Alphaproteobacteria bacterium]
MKDLTNLFKNNVETVNFDQIKISVSSPEQIRSWSFGEIKKPETINYRTFKPEREGLFCARIFGPTKDYECLCGKYKRMKFKGITCEKCGVEVTLSKVRRERMAHIELAAPVAHIWFLKSLPSRIGLALDITLKSLEKVLYFESHIVIDPLMSGLESKQLLNDEELEEAIEMYGEDSFKHGIGAEAVYDILSSLNLEEEIQKLKEDSEATSSETKKKKILKRSKVLEGFKRSNIKPEWMILKVLPVIPPELRPLVPLEGGRFATSDLNDLYRRVINRNNRLKRLLDLRAPDIIVRNEKRMLQESVDALFDNGRRGRVITSTNKRPLKSLSEMLKGKQGRFRQNLLGKRVDYSGRSVIVVGPELKLHQCGLPKKMALELFKPFIYNKLESYGFASTLKSARKMVETERPEVWDILDEVIREHPILLNRAPTLHRLGIQAFEPILIEGKAIQLHPLVCTAFNADFDGDQMAVHIPLSLESQLEARVLMMSTNNILSPSSGKPIIVPSQDIVLGIYYLSVMNENEEPKKYFSHIGEVEVALENKTIDLHTCIIYRTKTYNKETEIFEDKKFKTSAGRVILFKTLPENKNLSFDNVNEILTKKRISNLLDNVYRFTGQKATCIFVDQIMGIGFKYAAKAGISFGKDDLIIPEEKQTLISNTQKNVATLESHYQEGLITEREKYNKVVNLWSQTTENVSKAMMKSVMNSEGQINSLYIMADSGARGSETQLRQLAGMRGLMARPSGEIIENPITSNFKEGLSVLEYFNSTHGARKGLADTALKTASSGYLTRRLVDVAQDLTITKKDCGGVNGLTVDAIYESGELAIPLVERVFGRNLSADVQSKDGTVIMEKNTYISYKEIEILEKENITQVKIFSPITCANTHGMCAKCYGRDLAKGQHVNVGEAVGIIAAQSIGEPGTQLTMRTFHVGGVASSSVEKSTFESSTDGKVEIKNLRSVTNSSGNEIVVNRTTEINIYDINKNLSATFRAPYGSTILVKDKQDVKLSDLLLEWDPYTVPVIAEASGKLDFLDLVEGVSFVEKFDETTGISSKVIIDWKSFQGKADLKPQLIITDDSGEVMSVKGSKLGASYNLSVGVILNIEKGKSVNAGDIIARIPRASSKTKDITGGLPRVADIFESRKPKNPAVLAEISGTIEFGKDIKSKKRIIIVPSDESKEPVEYLIPKGTYVYFNEGDEVNKGDMLVDGTPAPSDILNILGVEALAEYMVREVQKVYRLQGVLIDDKHIECITKQMLQKVELIDAGDSGLPIGDVMDKSDVLVKNEQLKSEDKKEITYKMLVLGITKASLQTNSFISAASFQETTRVLTEAAINGKVDKLVGLKENVIVGKLIPAGTGNVIRDQRKQAKLRDIEILKAMEQEKEDNKEIPQEIAN